MEMSDGSAPARRIRRRVVVYVCIYLLIQLVILFSGAADSDIVCDDAFYYFQIARNAALGRGFTFDGLAATNGFHPLYMWLIVPIFAVLQRDAWGAVRAALVVLPVASAAAAWGLYHLGCRLRDDALGELMVVCFLLSPFSWLLPLRGCEGALAVLSLVLVAERIARYSTAGPLGLRESLTLGALVGLGGLARTELVLLGAVVAAWVLWRARSAKQLAVFSAAALAVVSPWVVWNLVTFGTIVQVSGAAKHALNLYGRLPVPGGPLDVVRNLAFGVGTPFTWIGQEEFGLREILAAPWRSATVWYMVVAVVLLVASGLAARRWPRHRVVGVLGSYALLHLGYYIFYQRAYYNWYFLPVVAVVSVIQAEWLADARPRARAALLTASVLAGSVMVAHFFWAGTFARRGQELRHAPLMTALGTLPPGSRVGSKDAGAIGYFAAFHAPDVHIVNLDCVVNNPAFEAYRRGAYRAYVLQTLDWLAYGEPPRGFLGIASLRIGDEHFVHQGDTPLYRVVGRPGDR